MHANITSNTTKEIFKHFIRIYASLKMVFQRGTVRTFIWLKVDLTHAFGQDWVHLVAKLG